ncbi:MAG: DUF4198 domain-containing protein [Pseudomonadota bacterium]
MICRSTILVATLLALAGAQAAAHEFWIAPERYQVEVGRKLKAHIRVGDMFKGPGNVYLPDNFARFDVVHGGSTVPVKGRLGDLPALQMPAPGEGLVIAVYQSTTSNVHYMEWAKFAKFVNRKGFPDALVRHKERGIRQQEFLEAYRRFAKSLMAVGHGRGSDRDVGLETEFVAEANPYTDDLQGKFPVRLLYQGKPRSGAQIEIFSRSPEGEVGLKRTTTDAHGRASIPVKAGHEYLLDAVLIRPLDGKVEERQAVWETLWAGLTFRVPR